MAPSRSRWRDVVSPKALLLSLYFYGSVHSFQPTICSSENTSSMSPNGDDFQTEGLCHDYCTLTLGGGYAFSITQGRNCWCSNIAPGSSVSLSRCNFQCIGFPSEVCGAPGAGLYSYLPLGPKPKGTSGGNTPIPSSSEPPSSSMEPTTVYTPTPKTVAHTITTTKSKTLPNTTITKKPTTITTTDTITTPRPVTTTPTTPPVSSVSVSTEVITASGTTTTKYITYIGSEPVSATGPVIVREAAPGLSGGAIAGVVIGAIVGIAAIALLIFFCCWRPRRQANENPETGERALGRNTSVLSKVGLLRSGSARNSAPPSAAGPGPAAPAAVPISNRPPRLNTDIPTVSVSGGPSSAATGGTMMSSRRDSRPIFVDHRLNPNAVMAYDNTSHTSLTTLQDNQDYSRPLEVRNP